MTFFRSAFPPTRIGWVRFVFHKYEKDPDDKFGRGIEIFFKDSFDTQFINARNEMGTTNLPDDIMSQTDCDEQLADVAKDLPEGYYEVVGEFWYEDDPGFDSPNGPAEFDCWWWMVNPQFMKLSEEQIKKWLPTPPPPPEQAWEHNTSISQGGRMNNQCAQCKKWAHSCSSCGYMPWEEETYCSENCWKAAGSPKEPEIHDEHVQS